MSFLVDKYNIINREVFSDISERYNNENLIIQILNNKRINYDLEKISNNQDEFKKVQLDVILKNYMKEYKKELTHLLKKKDINILTLSEKFTNTFEKIKLISLMLNRDIVYKSEDKPLGNYPEIDYYVKNICNEILDDNDIKNSIYKSLMDDKHSTSKFILLISWFDKYQKVSDNFLKDYSNYIVKNNTVNVDNMKHIELMLTYSKYEELKKFYYVFNKNDAYLHDMKMKLINDFSSFIQSDSLFIQDFIISNPKMISEIIMITEKLNYMTSLFLAIFVVLDKNNFIEKNMDKIFNFISNLASYVDKSKKNFIKKTIMDKLMENERNILKLVDDIIYGRIKNPIVLELIGVNEMVLNYFHEMFKSKITPLIINQELSYDKIKNIIEFFKNSNNNFNKLTHDLEIIQNDTIFSNKFSKDVNKNFGINTKNYVINSNFWAVNHNEGHILYPLKFDYDKKDNINNLCNMISSSYNVATEEKRKFELLAHVGNVSFDYKLGDVSKKIKMLPIQSIVFQKIYDYNKTTVDIIVNDKLFSNYNKKFINEVIDSLVEGTIILKQDTTLLVNPTIQYIREDYVEIIFSEKITKMIEYTPVLDKTTVINCWVNKLVKNKELSFNELFEQITTELNCGHLIISPEDLEKSITYMKNNDYIEEKEGKYTKLFY